MATSRRTALAVAVALVIAVPAVAVAAVAVAAAAPGAPAVPGATYSGTAADGAHISFTVSSDGTLVSAYQVTNAHGTAADGSGCAYFGGGDAGVWSGAPITNNAFSYTAGTAIVFTGVFKGAQSAQGTFRFSNPSSSANPGCDTGTVNWTAATTARPPAGSGSTTTATGGRTSKKKKSVATRVVFRRLSSKRLGGWLTSSQRRCRPGRTVYLWRGSKRVATARTTSTGHYSFKLSRSLRGRAVRAAVRSRTISNAVCAAGSSVYIRG
jgi:hypothetical protein